MRRYSINGDKLTIKIWARNPDELSRYIQLLCDERDKINMENNT